MSIIPLEAWGCTGLGVRPWSHRRAAELCFSPFCLQEAFVQLPAALLFAQSSSSGAKRGGCRGQGARGVSSDTRRVTTNPPIARQGVLERMRDGKRMGRQARGLG